VLELARAEAAVVLCAASPEAVDAVEALGGVLRVAPDEALVLGPVGSVEALVTDVRGRATANDDDAIVLDATDGWTIWTVRGSRAREAFTFLSALELPHEGSIQGEVARVHVKVVARGDRLDLLVPSMWGDHLRGRIRADCAHLGVVELPGPIPWTPAEGSQGDRT